MGMRVWAVGAVIVASMGVSVPPLSAGTAPQVDAAEAADELTAASAHLPAGARVSLNRDGSVESRDTVSDLLLGVEHYRGRAAWLSAAAAVVEKTSGTDVAVASDEQTAEEPAEEEWSGSVVQGIPAGDLDGDGLDDVLTATYDVAAHEVLLEARRGVDAAPLWEHTTRADGAMAWPMGADADGDGAEDLSVQSLQIHTEEVVEECDDYDGEEWCWPVEYHATFTWTLGVASGATGHTLWSREVPGSIDEVYDESSQGNFAVGTYDGRYELTSTNLYVFGLAAGDLIGRGAQDMVVNELDLDVAARYAGTAAGPARLSDGALQVRAVTRADVADAATGAVRKSLSDTAHGRVSFLYPVSDSVGGPGPDLLWDRTVVPDQEYECVSVDVWVEYVSHCPDEFEEGWSVALDVLDGESLESAWSVTVPDGWFAFSLGDDFDSDDRSDLMAFSENADGYKTVVLSGATGALLWEHESTHDWLFPAVVGQLDEVPGDDLVTTAFEWGESDGATIVIDRRSGRTGEVISSTEHSLPAPSDDDAHFTAALIYVAGGSDGDGDAVGDLTVGWIQSAYRFDALAEEPERLSLESHAVAESGRSGDARRVLSVKDQAAVLAPIDDLSGDGLADVLDQRSVYDWEADLETVRWTASPFVAGPDLWTTGASGRWVWLYPAGDQDGQPGNEVLLETYFSEGNRWSSTLDSLSGRTGTPRWSLSTR